MTFQLLKASAFQMPLAAGSVQCIVTSPPYWALRKYLSQGADQYGLEPTPEAYVESTLRWLREAWRVLRDDGILWLNIGDSYYGSGKGSGGSSLANSPKQRTNKGSYHEGEQLGALSTQKHSVLKPGDLCLIPERIAIDAQEEGWYVRSRCIWHVTNRMPHPCKTRPNNDLEFIWQLTKRPSGEYFYDAAAVAVPAKPEHFKRYESEFGSKPGSEDSMPNGKSNFARGKRKPKATRNLRTVWSFSNGQVKGAHTAAFNPELPRRCILASTRPGDLVLDPFCGSGTTGMVATRLGRRFVGLDLYYHDDARSRIMATTQQAAESLILETASKALLEGT